MLLNNEWVNNEIKEERKKVSGKNENPCTTIQNLWDTTKAALKGKVIAMQPYLKEIKQFPINNLTLHLQELEEQKQTKHRAVKGRK